VAGLDEVGRGCLAGPVVAAAVILDREQLVEGVTDSKLVSATKREVLANMILKSAVGVGLGFSSPEEIEEINILGATRTAMYRAIGALPVAPDHLVVDALKLNEIDLPQDNIIKGDRISYSIAAASIVAKVARDRVMKHYASSFPEFGFETNKGYGTPEHLKALARVGPSPIHRRGFKGVCWDQGLLAFGS
jgi:ribonuclease HII